MIAHSDRIEIGDIEDHIEPVISAGVANSQPTNFLIDAENVPDCSSNGILKIGPNGPVFDQPHDSSSQPVPYSVGATGLLGFLRMPDKTGSDPVAVAALSTAATLPASSLSRGRCANRRSTDPAAVDSEFGGEQSVSHVLNGTSAISARKNDL